MEAKAAGFMHMTATREYLLGVLDRYPEDWRTLVPSAGSLDEARRAITKGPAVHPVGDCEGFDYAKGECPGHARDE